MSAMIPASRSRVHCAMLRCRSRAPHACPRRHRPRSLTREARSSTELSAKWLSAPSVNVPAAMACRSRHARTDCGSSASCERDAPSRSRAAVSLASSTSVGTVDGREGWPSLPSSPAPRTTSRMVCGILVCGILHMHTHAFGEAVCCLKNSSCALPAVPCAPLRWSRKRFWPLRQTYSTCCRLRAGGGLASIARADEATSLH